MTRKELYSLFEIVLVFALVIMSPAARADADDQATQMTFNQPVRIPVNTVLPSGTYWFVLYEDSGFKPDIVQIYNAERTQLLATVETIPTTRTNSTDRTELTFAKQQRNRPDALISWFYPGLKEGHEFVYSRSEEAQLSVDPRITLMAHNEGRFIE